MNKKFVFIFIGLLAILIISIISFRSSGDKEIIPETLKELTFAETDSVPLAEPKPVLQAKPKVEPAHKKTMIPSVYAVEIPEQLTFAGEEVPMDIFYVNEYFDRELTANTYFHSSTILLLKRANRWFPVIEPILAKHNIPADFKYLALIESGFQNVTSPAGAKGFWQFLKYTAREYKLEVNNDIDERYNVEKSTVAACNYLNEAYEKYHNWTLVAAAYNAGNRRITEELEQQKVGSYYELLLNAETARYVFRILAIKTIFETPASYGFHLKESDLYPPIPSQTIRVTKTVKDLVAFASQYGINYKTLKYFNPWLKKDYLPNRSGRTYLIKIPLNGNIKYPLHPQTKNPDSTSTL